MVGSKVCKVCEIRDYILTPRPPYPIHKTPHQQNEENVVIRIRVVRVIRTPLTLFDDLVRVDPRELVGPLGERFSQRLMTVEDQIRAMIVKEDQSACLVQLQRFPQHVITRETMKKIECVSVWMSVPIMSDISNMSITA